MKHTFIFSSGYWIGEGNISFSGASDVLHFFTKWIIQKEKDETIICDQIVEMQGSQDHVINRFTITNILESTFEIELTNDLIGTVKGKGIYDHQMIGWEFRQDSGLEGFETFTKTEDGDYKVHAEYVSEDLFRSTIEATIWKKEEVSK